MLAAYSIFLDGIIITGYGLLVAIIPFVILLYIKKNYQHLNTTKKYITMILTAVITSLIVISATWFHYLSFKQVGFSLQQSIHSLFQICTFYIISLTVHTYFIESMLSHLRLVKQIHETEKLNIVSELAASFAHEIRNPLTVVRGLYSVNKR